MLYSGLVSISFRPLDVEQIIALCVQNGLSCVEWGGDVHVPHGNLRQARAVGEQTRSAGLRVSSYGSYYKVGHHKDLPFNSVLDTAAALGAPLIRVWAGTKGSDAADADYRRAVVADARQIAIQAASMAIDVAFEYHSGTLMDQTASAIKLLYDELDHEGIKTFWQPPWQMPFAYCLDGLRQIKDRLANVHCFAWDTQQKRQLLAAQQPEWRDYLNIIAKIPGDHDVLLEFVKEDDPDNLTMDARELNQWLTEINR